MAGTLGFGWRADQTPYTRHGDWFAWIGLVLAGACLVVTQWPNYVDEKARAALRLR